MADLFFRGPLIGMPGISNAERAAQAMEDLRRRAADLEDPGMRDWVGEVEADPIARGLLEAVFSNSPFLTRCALAEIPFLREILGSGPDTAFGHVITSMKDELSRLMDQDRLMRELRIARRRVALAVALADITDHWPLERITQALSDFADGALSATISHLMLRAAEKGDLVLADEYFPEDDCGYVALAMGKHGARELNYSTDIDLIILYEPMKADYRGSRSLQEAFIRMTQRLVAILDQRTADGYVCRVDLRLRPDPGSTPVAIPCAAAQSYYANRGKNWERAAMIKARPAAGDMALGREFLGELTPFVWREHLDFWAKREIQNIKRQIHAQRGGHEIGFLGHNIKLGRGGIREIEFFAQVQQLIFAGRDPYLRCQRTLDALTTLAEAGFIDEAVAEELSEAYEFLRKLEHRLQMVEDQQTQTLPSDDTGMERLAVFMGFEDVREFRDTVLRHLSQVEAPYNDLFEEAASPREAESLDFKSPDPNEQTAGVLEQFGYRDVPEAYRRLRAWHEGGLPVTEAEKERTLLVELIPSVVERAAKTSDPDWTLECVDDFLAGLASGSRCLSLLAANPVLLELLVEILTTAPALTATLSGWPEQLETAVSPGFFDMLPDRRLMLADSAEVFKAATGLQGALELASKWAGEHEFQLAANVLRHTIESSDAGHAFSGVAEAACHHLFDRLARDLGQGPDSMGADMVVVAHGLFGIEELNYRSPLNLFFVFEPNDTPSETSAGLAEHLIEMMHAQTPLGRLYDISEDRTLWGRDGPLVISLDGLADLCAETASGPQLLALMQARVAAGPADLARRVSQGLKDVFVQNRAPESIAAIVAARGREGLDRGAGSRAWSPRWRHGGLHDLETIVRVLQLRGAAPHPDVLTPSIPGALAGLTAAGLLAEPMVRDLLGAHHLLRQAENIMAISIAETIDPGDAPQELRAALARAAGLESFGQLETALEEATQRVRDAYKDLVKEHRRTPT